LEPGRGDDNGRLTTAITRAGLTQFACIHFPSLSKVRHEGSGMRVAYAEAQVKLINERIEALKAYASQAPED